MVKTRICENTGEECLCHIVGDHELGFMCRHDVEKMWESAKPKLSDIKGKVIVIGNSIGNGFIDWLKKKFTDPDPEPKKFHYKGWTDEDLKEILNIDVPMFSSISYNTDPIPKERSLVRDLIKQPSKSIHMNETFNFGEALKRLYDGKFVTRSGWNGKGMYLWVLPGVMIQKSWAKDPHLLHLCNINGGEIEALPTIRMLTADQKIVTGWLASQTDMAADDWMEVFPMDTNTATNSGYVGTEGEKDDEADKVIKRQQGKE